jgi:hypothetical protein
VIFELGAGARIDRDPVYFPGFAVVFGERLFEATGIRFDVGNDEADQDRTRTRSSTPGQPKSLSI